MPKRLGVIYGSARKRKGRVRDARDIVMKDGVLDAKGTRKMVVYVKANKVR